MAVAPAAVGAPSVVVHQRDGTNENQVMWIQLESEGSDHGGFSPVPYAGQVPERSGVLGAPAHWQCRTAVPPSLVQGFVPGCPVEFLHFRRQLKSLGGE